MTDRDQLRAYYKGLEDEELLDVADAGADAFEPDAWFIVTAEIAERGLVKRAPLPPPEPKRAARPDPLDSLRALSDVELNETLRIAEKRANAGALWLIAGVGITVFAFSQATGGGSYFFAWGAMLYGISQAFRWQRRADRFRPVLRSRQPRRD